MNPAYVSLIALLIQKIMPLITRNKYVKLASPLIEQAMADGSLPDNDARAKFVANLLQSKYGLSESDAKIVLEFGIKLWQKRKLAQQKRDEKDKAKAEKRAARLNR